MILQNCPQSYSTITTTAAAINNTTATVTTTTTTAATTTNENDIMVYRANGKVALKSLFHIMCIGSESCITYYNLIYYIFVIQISI